MYHKLKIKAHILKVINTATHTHTLKLTKKRVKIVHRVDGIYCTLLIMYE